MLASRTASRIRSISGDSFTRELRKYSSMNAAQSFTDWHQMALLEVSVNSVVPTDDRKNRVESMLYIPWITGYEYFGKAQNIGALAAGLLD